MASFKKTITRMLGKASIVVLPHVDRMGRDLIMPKYLYHAPLDYELETHPPVYGENVHVPGESLPIPPPDCRPGYSPDDDKYYLEWGRNDHDRIVNIIERHMGLKPNMHILDWGCSSGRVLRHFYNEAQSQNWKLHGIDISAHLIHWMRLNFPSEFDVMTGSTLPHLPFRDSSLDVIYGISVFTHTKFLWDLWLAEFRRVLKPNGLCIQTVQCETAWEYYHAHREEEWVKAGHPQSMLNKPQMDEDFFLFGDGRISQTFYKEGPLKQYWGRYMTVVDFLAPSGSNYQNCIVLQNTDAL